MNMMKEPGKQDYKDMLVKKPWGYEYLVYENKDMAIWCLHLKKDEQTSMHCHPDKKTGLIVVEGEIEVSFLNDKTQVRSLSKLMIRPGLFHSSKAVSDHGAILFELENPVDKENLVRFEDNYGRKEKPYEGKQAMEPLGNDALRLPELETGEEYSFLFHNIEMTLINTASPDKLFDADNDELFAILRGGLSSNTKDVILGPGDVVKPDIFKKLSTTFTSEEGITLIRMKKGSHDNTGK